MKLSTAIEEHCDWCGGEMGNRSIHIRAIWRGEYLRVHPHCAEDVAAKNARVEAGRAALKDTTQ